MDGEVVLDEIKALRKQMDDMQKTLNWIVASQQANSEMVRKSANSINVVIRLLGVQLRLNMDDLSSMLIESEALLETIKQPIHLKLNSVQLNDSSVIQYKLMLNNLAKAIDISHKHNIDIENKINHINKQSASTQTEVFHVTPLTNALISHNQIPADVPQINNNNDSLVDSVMIPIHNNVLTNINPIDINRKKKEDEERNRLRRKYNNKYRYLNITKNVQSIQNIDNTTENTQKSDELPNTENKVKIFLVNHVDDDIPLNEYDLSECGKTILRSMTSKPLVLLNKIDDKLTQSLKQKLKTDVTNKMIQQCISTKITNEHRVIRNSKKKSAKIKVMRRKQRMAKNKTKYIMSSEKRKNSKSQTKKNL